MIFGYCGVGSRPHRRRGPCRYWQRVMAGSPVCCSALGCCFVSKRNARCSCPIGNQIASANLLQPGLAHAPSLRAIDCFAHPAAKTDRLNRLRQYRQPADQSAAVYGDRDRSFADQETSAKGCKSAVQSLLPATTALLQPKASAAKAIKQAAHAHPAL